jgi:hypothetical protein
MEDHEIRIPQPGERYEHYKGGIYDVITVGRLSEQRDQLMVVYRSLERGHVWIRPLGMWSEYVEITETSFPVQDPIDPASPAPLSIHYHTRRAQRFRLLGTTPERP